jgi:hypothetical protein
MDVRPALRLGGASAVGDAIVTTYLELGAKFVLRDGEIEVSMPYGPSSSPSVTLDIDRDPVLASMQPGLAILSVTTSVPTLPVPSSLERTLRRSRHGIRLSNDTPTAEAASAPGRVWPIRTKLQIEWRSRASFAVAATSTR